MFKYKIGHRISEETKDLITQMFLFRIIVLIELVGFSMLFTFFTLCCFRPRLNFILIFLFFLLLNGSVYFIVLKPRR